nr:hypothetical protein [Melittangium boletus]
MASLLSAILEGLLMLAMSRGVSWMVKALRGTALGRKIGEARLAEWLNRRVDAFRESRAGRPREVLGHLSRQLVEARFFRQVELILRTKKGKNMTLGEFDGIDMARRMFIEYKTARRLQKASPPRSATDWADAAILGSTVKRIQALLHDATGTRVTHRGSAEVPSLAEIQGFRRLPFRIDADSPALRVGVAQALSKLRVIYPDWTFEVQWGVNILLPPLPDWVTVGMVHESQ